MNALVNSDTEVSFLIEWGIGESLNISQVIARGPGAIYEARFLSTAAADQGLYPGLGAFVRDLARAVRNHGPHHPARRRFLKRLDQLVLEDLRVARTDEGGLLLTLKLTQGEVGAVFGSKNLDIISDSFADVFLPLTNLSAYLRALSDTKGSTAGYAMDQTADRIEEFLLVYGHRLQGGAQVVRLTA